MEILSPLFTIIYVIINIIKMISKDKLFDLIGISSNENNSSEVEYNIDFLKSKMFTKLIEGSDYLKDTLKKSLVKSNSRTDDLAECLVFNRAVEYIETININELQNSPEFTRLFRDQFIKSLQKAIKYFEVDEKYEICAFLFNIEKTLKNIKNT